MTNIYTKNVNTTSSYVTAVFGLDIFGSRFLTRRVYSMKMSAKNLISGIDVRAFLHVLAPRPFFSAVCLRPVT